MLESLDITSNVIECSAENMSTVGSSNVEDLNSYRDGMKRNNSNGSTESLDGVPYLEIYRDIPTSHHVDRKVFGLKKNKVSKQTRDVDRDSAWLAGVPVKFIVEDIYESPKHIVMNMHYRIYLEHGGHRWTVICSFGDLVELEMQFRKLSVLLNFGISRKDVGEKYLVDVCATLQKLRLQNRLLFDKSQHGLEDRKKGVEKFLHILLDCRYLLQLPEVRKLFGVSPLSFVRELGPKYLEGVVKKRCGGYTRRFLIVDSIRQRTWKKRYAILKEHCLIFMDDLQNRISQVLLFDSSYNVERNSPLVLTITCKIRNVALRFDGVSVADQWEGALLGITKDSNGRPSEFIKPKTFSSFASRRLSQKAMWFVDGYWYFRCVADAMEKAREEIFITDWWLTPELYLKRPVKDVDDVEWRLDTIIKRRASHGVRVYILLYQEMSMAVHTDSKHSKDVLTQFGECPNVKVLRHPKHVLSPRSTFLWSHHEKMVCIDQSVVFFGGLDLCMGRWDDHLHRLTDMLPYISSSINQSPRDLDLDLETCNYDGQSVIKGVTLHHTERNANGSDFSRLQSSQLRAKFRAVSAFKSAGSPNYKNVSEKRTDGTVPDGKEQPEDAFTIPQQPSNGRQRARILWDTLKDAIHKKKYLKSSSLLPAETSVTKASPPTQQKSQSSAWKSVQDKVTNSSPSAWKVLKQRLSMNRMPKTVAPDRPGWLHQYDANLVRRDKQLRNQNDGQLKQLWIGKDYANYLVAAMTNLNQPFEDLVNREVIPRIPWHDVAGIAVGEVARDFASHFIQRWNFTKRVKTRRKESIPVLVPKTLKMNDLPSVILPPDTHFIDTNITVLRSVSRWSAGQETECSILEAYKYAIDSAQDYIYIENQFFISICGHASVKNPIAERLFERIRRAHYQETKFRVFVVIPLLNLPVECTMWVMRSICMHRNSILKRISEELDCNPSEYISFCDLRAWAQLKEHVVGELIYVHSKLLIADDRLVIIGSANINDRSLLGNRDSELAVMIEDVQKTDGMLGGSPAKIGIFASSLRKRLFREHLGLWDSPEVSLEDPASDDFWNNVWLKRAHSNAAIFEEVFQKYPTNKVKTEAELDAYLLTEPLSVTDTKKALELLKDYQGYLCRFPTGFLCDVKEWKSQRGTRGALVPDVVWC